MNKTGISAKVISTEMLTTPGRSMADPEARLTRRPALPPDSRPQSPPPTSVVEKKAEGKPAEKQSGAMSYTRVKWASLLLGLIGVTLLGISLIVGYAGTFSLLLSLEGISLILIAILVYFVTPRRLVQGDVCAAEAVSSVELVNALLAPAAGDAKGIYWPSGTGRATKVFIPTGGRDACRASENDIVKISVSGTDGLLINPPGAGLLQYAKSLGATFSDDGLESEIRDVLVNGTELASRADVKRDAGGVYVRLTGLAGEQMCRTLRQKYPAACYQAGCPVCSFVACMVVEGTGKPAIISEVKPDGRALAITYKLL